MGYLLAGGSVFLNGAFQTADVAVEDGRIVSISPFLSRKNQSVIKIDDLFVVPGFVDVHVHLREPGFSYKETIASGTAAAAAGGYTAVCSMPNLKPVPDSPGTLQPELDAIVRDAKIRVYPYGAITAGEQGQFLSDMEGMAPRVAGFSDDGRGVQSDDMMRAAMKSARALGRPIAAHCEVNGLLTPGGCVHDGIWARVHGFPGIPPQSEWRQIERDIGLVRETGCQYHVCHISAKESVDLIRRAKDEGLPVTCETGPHSRVLCEDDLKVEGRFKMNPPLRSAADRDALIEGLLDGTIDCIATDHAPHSAEEKSGGLRQSAFGIVGLETAFPILYTQLVQTGIVPLELLLDRLCTRPRRIFALPGGDLTEGAPADLTVLDLNRPHAIVSGAFKSLGRATPFDGWMVSAAVAATICNGKLVYTDFQREDV